VSSAARFATPLRAASCFLRGSRPSRAFFTLHLSLPTLHPFSRTLAPPRPDADCLGPAQVWRGRATRDAATHQQRYAARRRLDSARHQIRVHRFFWRAPSLVSNRCARAGARGAALAALDSFRRRCVFFAPDDLRSIGAAVKNLSLFFARNGLESPSLERQSTHLRNSSAHRLRNALFFARWRESPTARSGGSPRANCAAARLSEMLSSRPELPNPQDPPQSRQFRLAGPDLGADRRTVDPVLPRRAGRAINVRARATHDINNGFPGEEGVHVAAGSALLEDEPRVARILELSLRGGAGSGHAEIRTGPRRRNGAMPCRIAPSPNRRAWQVALDSRPHARLMFDGCADPRAICEVKSWLRIPLVANGDVPHARGRKARARAHLGGRHHGGTRGAG